MTNTRAMRRLALAAATASLLAGCQGDNVRQAFGIGKRQPDEFQVVRREPLIVPNDLRLRPPRPGAEGPATSGGTDAATALTGEPALRAATMSPGEQALLEAIPGRPVPNIRTVLAQEESQTEILDRGQFLFILRFQRPSGPPPGTVIDPTVEAQRLQAAGIVTTTRTDSTPITTR